MRERNKLMKKLAYIIPGIAIAVLAVIGILFLVKGISSTERTEIYVCEIDYRIKGLSLGELEVSKWNRDPPTSMSFTPIDENKLMSLIVSSEYYKGEMSYEGNDGYYFVKNNNAYFLYEYKDNSWVLRNMYSSCDVNGEYSYSVPGPGVISYSFGVESMTETLRLVDRFYELKTYNETKQFYMNFDGGFAIFNDEEQTIKIKVYDGNEYTEAYRIIYDFVKKDIGTILDDGSIDWARDQLSEINSGE